ncbi:hypothetical protein THAOC_04664 [Thalassiosira oceanica]|uniref:Uncharacterized protein n=1 Tax=Thalassiosira oceanica TaxID=159749 RepID=K0TNQ6_THAOC|nr:hypothetical protein THAOC_04664 [Thalassiosira oceanica]|eukprot:EJK73697.1 hypothetical protein THAOC_04664 [Thalassiosira oceanica]
MAGEKLVRNCILGNGSLRPTTPYEGKTLHQKVWEEITFTTPDTDIVEDQNGNIRVAIPFWVRSTERDRHTKTGRKGVEVTLNVNALGDTLIPIPDSVKLMSAKDTNKSAPRERKFKVMEGFIPVRDKHDNPIYQSRTSSKRGHWLVSDYLSEDDLKRVLDFSRKHRLADLGTVLFVLCKFVSDIPEAKRLWDKDRELENAQDSRFQEEIELCESFLQELFATAAEHISSNADFKRILNRFLWENLGPVQQANGLCLQSSHAESQG